MKNNKKWISIILCVCMIVAIMPTLASPANAANASAKYKDVIQTEWYVPYVDYVVEHGLMSGTSSTAFVPNGKVTRAQYVQVLYALAGKPSGAKKAGFTDVESGKWYTDAVNWAAAVGVTGGMTKTTFAPNVAVSREQAATFFKAYASKVANVEVDESKDLSSFPDKAAVSNYAVTPMKWAVGAGLISGVKSGNKNYLQPKGTLTRAQLATMMKAFDVYLEKKQAEDKKTEDDGEQVGGSDSSVDIYTVVDLSIDEKNRTAAASVSAPGTCTLRVRFISEDVYFSDKYPQNKTYLDDGKLYATATVPAGTNLEEVRASIQGTLPKYYVAEAILVDANGKELCNYITTIVHTKRHEEFEEKTVNDFPDATAVLNYDNDLDDNFGVLADDVLVLTASDLTVAENENGKKTYTVKDPSEKISAGDKVFIQDADSNELFRVKTITQKNGVYTIVPATAEDSQYGYELNDFYQFIKADMEYDGNLQGEGQLKTLSDDSEHSSLNLMGMNVIPVVNDTRSLKISPSIKYETDHFKVEAKAGGELAAEVEIEWDPNLLGEDYFKVDLKTVINVVGDVKAVGKISNKEANKEKLEKLKETKELKFGKVKIPFGISGLDAFADIKLCVEWEIAGGVHFTSTSKDECGFTYNTKDGKQNILKRSRECKLNLEGEAEIKFGPKPSVGIEFLNGTLSAGVEIFTGGVGTASLEAVGIKWGTVKHACTTCISGEVKLAVEPHISLKYRITKKISGTAFDVEFLHVEIPLFTFYVSIINPKDSIFGGKFKMGRGTCPNIAHKTIINVEDSKGEIIKTKANVLDKNGKEVAKIDSGDSLWLYPGSYEAKADINGTQESKSFEVTTDNSSIMVTIKPTTTIVNPGKTSPNIITEVPEGFTGIYDASGLSKVQENPTGNYILMADIDLSSIDNWTPIGTLNSPFKGVFRGEGHTISNLTITSMENDYAGLFGVVSGADISGINITGKINCSGMSGLIAGGVAAYIADETRLSSCISYVDIIFNNGNPTGNATDKADGNYIAGGVVGGAWSATILGCGAYGDIRGTGAKTSMSLGGIAGNLFTTSVFSCYSHCNISAETDYVGVQIGGIAGNATCGRNNPIHNSCSNTVFQYKAGNEKDKKYNDKYTVFVGGICGNGLVGDGVKLYDSINITSCYYLSTSANSASGVEKYVEGKAIKPVIDAKACSQSEINNKAKEMGFAV